MKNLFEISCLLLATASLPLNSHAAIRPSQRHEAGGNKTGQYISDGFFVGGERSVTSVRLKDIRRAKSNGYERIVLDLETQGEDGNAVPFFQVTPSLNEGRIVFSIWADVTYDFDAARVNKNFLKSANVKRLSVVPRVEEGLSVIEMTLKPSKAKIEVFRLAHPARIIVDIL